MNIPYLIAVILFILWGIFFFAYNVSGIVHLMPVVALIAIIVGMVSEADKEKNRLDD